MSIAYLSPLPPVRSGVSEYSADLVPHLARHLELRLFAEPPAAGEIGGLAVELPGAFDAGSFSGAIYHLGNNVHHHFIHQRAIAAPGIAVFHDLVLHHYHVEQTLARDRADDYRELMAQTYGEVGRGVAEARIDDVTSELPYFYFPLFEQVAARSRGIIVHNRRAARLIAERVDGVPIEVVAMGVPDAASDPLAERGAARRELGIDPADFVVGLFGFVTPIKRPDSALKAFAALRQRRPAARMVVIGEVSSSLNLAGLAAELGVVDAVTLTGYVDYQDVKRWVGAVDVFVNLRYPTAGETSASLLRLLGWGKPVIVSDYAQFRELPPDVAPRVALDDWEIAELTETLAVLADKPELVAAIGERAARYVAEEHGLPGAARAYADFVTSVGGAPADGRMKPCPLRITSRTPGRPRARIELAALPGRWLDGTRMKTRVRLTNTGDTVWLRGPFASGGYAVFGGYLRDPATGDQLVELTWVGLSRDVQPGETVELNWEFRVPARSGDFELVADVKIADWGWLHERGSEAALQRVRLARVGSFDFIPVRA